MKVIPVTSDAHWHELRARNVGGSESAALFGKSPYGDELEGQGKALKDAAKAELTVLSTTRQGRRRRRHRLDDFRQGERRQAHYAGDGGAGDRRPQSISEVVCFNPRRRKAKMTQAVAVKKDVAPPAKAVSPVDSVRAALEKMKPQMEMALPKHLTSDRLLRVAMTAIQNNPKLLECTRTSLFAAIMSCAHLRLEPDGVLGQATSSPMGPRCNSSRATKA